MTKTDENRLSEGPARDFAGMVSKHTLDGVCFYASPACRSLLGYEPGGLVGRSVHEFAHPEDRSVVERFYTALSGAQDAGVVAYRATKKDGTQVRLETIGWAMRDPDTNEVREIVTVSREASGLATAETTEAGPPGVVQDKRKSAETRLRDAEARYRSLVERVPAVIYVDAEGEGRSTVYISPQVEALLGYHPDDFLSDPDYWVKALHPDDREHVVAGLRRATETGEPFRMEYRLIARDRRVVWVRDDAVPVRDAGGGRRLWQGVRVDITTLKRAEEDLVRMAAHPMVSPNPLIEANLAGEVTYLNPVAERLFPDLRVLGSRHPMLAGLESTIGEVQGAGRPVVREVPVGESFYEQTITWVPGSNLLRVYAIDTTEHRRTADALRASEEIYRTVVEHVAENIFVADVETGRVLESNAAFNTSLGYGPQEIRNLTLYDFIAHDRESIDRNIRLTLKSGHHVVGERKYRRKDGTLVDMEVRVSAITHGGRDALCAVAHDVTERKRAEEELRESHALLNSVVRGTADAIFVKDLRGRYVLVNTIAAEIMGRPEEEIIRRGDAELFGPEAAGTLVEVDHRVISTGKPISIEDRLPVAGTERTYLSTKAPYRDHRGKIVGVIGVSTDITERKQAEMALHEVREDERRRIARDLHDVVLHHIVGALQAMQATRVERVEPETGPAPEIDALRSAVQGLRNAIYDLRLEKNEPFVRAVESLVDLNRQLAPERHFVVTVEDGFSAQFCENVKVELARTVQEALTNARRHSGAGRIEVRLGVGPDGDDVVVEVTDEGRGFKPDAAVEGVGLSAMRERSRIMGAHLEIQSAVGAGTTVRISVPVR